MAAIEHVRTLMNEVGPALDLAEVAELAEASWALATKDKTILYVDLMEAEDRLWLSAEVGTPGPQDRERLYPLMLQYNAQWQRTGGARLALDGPEGAVVLACELPASGLDVPKLGTVLVTLRSMLEGWRKILAGGGAARAAVERTSAQAPADAIRA